MEARHLPMGAIMSALTDFLLRRIAEDEASAPSVHSLECAMLEYGGTSSLSCDCGWPEGTRDDCEAKRRIVAEHREQAGGECDVCSRHEYPCPTLRFLALPYAAYPDYREKWKP